MSNYKIMKKNWRIFEFQWCPKMCKNTGTILRSLVYCVHLRYPMIARLYTSATKSIFCTADFVNRHVDNVKWPNNVRMGRHLNSPFYSALMGTSILTNPNLCSKMAFFKRI